MGRPNRIQYAGACYHITLSGNNRQDVFLSNQDRRFCIQLLKDYKNRFGLKVYAYCLMENSIQVVLETPKPNLSRIMQGFSTAYTKYFNRQHGAFGHVFQGRYKALLVDKAERLLEVTIHTHLSPVREGLREKPWRYLWSSCAAYVESSLKEPLIDSDVVLSRLARSNRFIQSVRYLNVIKEKARQPQEPLAVRSGLFVAGEEFVTALGKAAAAVQAPEPEKALRNGQAILAEVAQKHGLDEERLRGRGQWRDLSAVRKEAVHRMWKEARMGVTDISRVFGRTPSAISQIIKAMEFPLKPVKPQGMN
ncbi:MAG: transposase [Elusimicrobiota bacterium]|jgi:REP element-mobilizing transposase RayT